MQTSNVYGHFIPEIDCTSPKQYPWKINSEGEIEMAKFSGKMRKVWRIEQSEVHYHQETAFAVRSVKITIF
jgi:hypothetical protein